MSDEEWDAEQYVLHILHDSSISGEKKKKVREEWEKKKKQWIKERRDGYDDFWKWERIEDNNDERDNYEVIDHTKLSPEQERNKPEHTWQKPRRD